MMCKFGGDQLKSGRVSNGDGNIARVQMLISLEYSPLFQFFQFLHSHNIRVSK